MTIKEFSEYYLKFIEKGGEENLDKELQLVFLSLNRSKNLIESIKSRKENLEREASVVKGLEEQFQSIKEKVAKILELRKDDLNEEQAQTLKNFLELEA